LRVKDEARIDRKKLFNYIRQEYDNLAYEKHLKAEFDKGFNRVRRQPFSCPVLQLDKPLEHEFRKLIIKNYIALYYFENEIVTIARIFHCKQDYDNEKI